MQTAVLKDALNKISIPNVQEYFPEDLVTAIQALEPVKAGLLENLAEAETAHGAAIGQALSGTCSAPSATLKALEAAGKPVASIGIKAVNLAREITQLHPRIQEAHKAARVNFQRLERERAEEVENAISKTTAVVPAIRQAIFGDPQRQRFKDLADGCTRKISDPGPADAAAAALETCRAAVMKFL